MESESKDGLERREQVLAEAEVDLYTPVESTDKGKGEGESLLTSNGLQLCSHNRVSIASLSLLQQLSNAGYHLQTTGQSIAHLLSHQLQAHRDSALMEEHTHQYGTCFKLYS